MNDDPSPREKDDTSPDFGFLAFALVVGVLLAVFTGIMD